MITFEEFKSVRSWWFSGTRQDYGIVGSKPHLNEQYEITYTAQDARTKKSSLQYVYVNGVEAAYEEVVNQIARAVDEYAGQFRVVFQKGSAESKAYLFSLYAHRSGFQPGTYKDWPVEHLAMAAFVRKDEPNEILVATAPYTCNERARSTNLMQLKLIEKRWKKTDLTPEFEAAVEAEYVQWATDALQLRKQLAPAP